MRQATMIYKNLWLRPMRTLLSIGGLAIAIGAVVALVGVSRRFEQSFLELYNRRGGDLVVQARGAPCNWPAASTSIWETGSPACHT